MSIKNLKDRAFKNSEVKAEYDLLELEFSLLDADDVYSFLLMK